MLAAALVYLGWRARRRPSRQNSLADAEASLLAGRCSPRLVAALPSEVRGRRWYPQVLVSDLSSSFTLPEGSRLLGLHLGCMDHPPESLVMLRSLADGWEVDARILLKRYARYSLLAFGWLPAFEAGSRALLIGLGAGSLAHYWLSCAPGGAELRVDAVELDGAVVRAAREHMGLRSVEADGHVRVHVADAQDFLREVEEEAYDLVFCDLDIGVLLPHDAEAGASKKTVQEIKCAKRANADDPPRSMYRSLTMRGVLVLNEYSEESPSVRLQQLVSCVRSLRRFFPEVHVLRPTDQNTLYFAPVARSSSPDTFLRDIAQRLQLPGVDFQSLLADLPPHRCQVYS